MLGTKQAVRGACPELDEGSLSNHNGGNWQVCFLPLLRPFGKLWANGRNKAIFVFRQAQDAQKSDNT